MFGPKRETLEELTVKRSPSALAVLALAACTLVLTACPPRESIAAINRDPAGMRGAKFLLAGAWWNPLARSDSLLQN